VTRHFCRSLRLSCEILNLTRSTHPRDLRNYARHGAFQGDHESHKLTISPFSPMAKEETVKCANSR
jgi:hypothetical protein